MIPYGPARFYRALLRLFPSEFREDFGADMEQLFRDRLREQPTSWARLRLYANAVTDVVGHAGREWGRRAHRGLDNLWEDGMRRDSWVQDLRFGVRTLRRRPGYTVAAVATLGLGIGATVSIFSVVNGVLLTPLPFPESERLVVLWSVNNESGARGRGVDHPDVRLWQEEVPGLAVVGYSGARPTLTELGAPEVVPGARVTDGLMGLMGYEPVLGRDLIAADDDPDGPRVVVVSHAFWAQRLGRDADVIGRTVQLDGVPWEIVGVAPPDFEYPRGAELWLPRQHDASECGHGCRIMAAIGKMRPGSTPEGIQSHLDAVSARLESEHPDAHTDERIELQLLLDTEVESVRAGLWVLFGAVAMVLLIACANVANLTLIRASQRGDEVALRAALGASRGRIMRQLLTESLLLAGAAGVLGLALSGWGTAILIAMAPDSLPRLHEAGLDPTVVGFTALLVLVVTSSFGLAPSLRLSRQSLRQGPSSGHGSGGRRGGHVTRSLLVSGEVGLSLALLLGAGLLFRTLVQIRQVDYGFDVSGAERFRLTVPDGRYDSLEVVRFLDQLEQRLAVLPGVAAVGTGFGVPLAPGSIGATVSLLDRPEVPPPDRPTFQIRPASPGFLEATGTSLLKGRWFTGDDRYGTEGVAVINETAARLHYDGVDPIGRRIRADVSWSFADTPPLTIVGVVGDVRGESARGLPDPALYLANTQFGANSVHVWLRLRPGVRTAMGGVPSVLGQLDPELAITNVTTIENVVTAEGAAPRFYLTLLSVFSALALVLASIGLYGVVAYSVSERRREIGVRIALGAASEQVARMVLWQGSGPVLAGIVIGLALSLLGARLLESLLYGVSPTDPTTVLAVTVLIAAVTGLATFLPARRASRIPPAAALRTE